MPAPGASWSRSEWLRRLGYKTGDQPPIAHALQPTLGSGDASELLPPLLAPQGWFGGISPNVAASSSAWEVHSRAVGGCFVQVDMDTNWGLSFETTRDPSFILTTVHAPVVEQPGIETVVTSGPIATWSATGLPIFVGAVNTTQPEFGPAPVYVPPGIFMYVTATAANIACNGAIHVRDVPVGLAPD